MARVMNKRKQERWGETLTGKAGPNTRMAVLLPGFANAHTHKRRGAVRTMRLHRTVRVCTYSQ